MWIALLPLMYPTTCKTGSFRGIENILWTWSTITCPSSTRLSFCSARLRNTGPRCSLHFSNSSLRRYFGMNTMWYVHSYFV